MTSVVWRPSMHSATPLFDDDLDGLADRMDEAHVYSMCTEAKDEAKAKKTNVTQIRSAATELG